jgi:hypothetical protein
MRTSTRCALVACLLGVVGPGLGFGRTRNDHVAPEARVVAGGRDVQIIVPQAEIRASVDVVYMGGLVGAAINASQAKKAERSVIPLREALAGYEFDPLVQKASADMLAELEWFGLEAIRLSKDASQDGQVVALNGAGTSQVMFLYYGYATDADYSSVEVAVTASLVNKAMPKNKRVQKPSMRFWLPYLGFHRTMRSVIRLPNADRWDSAANLRTWTADGGKLARDALNLGVQRCRQMLKRSLEMSASEAADMQKRGKRRMSKVPGVTGWILESDASHMLVYSGEYGWLTHFEKTGTLSTGSAD